MFLIMVMFYGFVSCWKALTFFRDEKGTATVDHDAKQFLKSFSNFLKHSMKAGKKNRLRDSNTFNTLENDLVVKDSVRQPTVVEEAFTLIP